MSSLAARSKANAIGYTPLSRGEPLFEGPCAYAVRTGECIEIIVYSTNCVQHVAAGITDDIAKAERICNRLNAYPRQTRQVHGLL